MEHPAQSFDTVLQLRFELRRALDRLEGALAVATAKSGWRDEVSAALTDLMNAFDAHVAEVEAPDGLLERLVEEEPRVAVNVETLEQEHVSIRAKIHEVFGRLRTSEPAQLRSDGMELCHNIILHRQLGADIVYEAFSADLGGLG